MKLVEQREKNLVSFKFDKIHDGEVRVDGRHLTSLLGAPVEVRSHFRCADNELTSLKGGPKEVGGSFYCANNQLVSLEWAPSKVTGGFFCPRNKLVTLEGAPQKVDGDFFCSRNQLTSLEGAPQEVGGNFFCVNNQLTSLKDIHKQIKRVDGSFSAFDNPIKSHVLGLLLIKGITRVVLDNTKVEDIINRYLGTGDIFSAQEELIEAGLEEYAQL
jgi:hypothetical protein